MTQVTPPAPEPPRGAAHWESRYVVGDVPWDKGRVDTNLQAALRTLDPGPCQLLEVGCGTGTDARWLAGQGYDVTAVDLSPTAIERARRAALREDVRVRFEVGSFPDLRASFDLVYDCGCFHTHESPDAQRAFATDVARCLRPGGHWLSILGSTAGPPRDHGPPRRSAREIVAAIADDFDLIELRDAMYDADLPTPARAWRLIARLRPR